MQSTDYVPGVSGWKIGKELMEFNGGPWGPVRIGDLSKAVDSKSPADKPQPEPFIVVDGVAYIRQAEVDEARIPKPKIASEWSVKVELLNGRYVASGIGLGLDSQFLVSADRFAVNGRDAGQILDDFASHISATAEQIKPVAETVRDVLREELKPGGILHRK
ncbi:phage tail tip fiber protein [Pseudomonas sp. TMB3-21]